MKHYPTMWQLLKPSVVQQPVKLNKPPCFNQNKMVALFLLHNNAHLQNKFPKTG
jgi:hypothetical protein